MSTPVCETCNVTGDETCVHMEERRASAPPWAIELAAKTAYHPYLEYKAKYTHSARVDAILPAILAAAQHVRAEQLTSAEVAALAVTCPSCGKAPGEFCAAGGSMSLMANGRAWHHQRFYAAANAFAGGKPEVA